MKDREIQPQDHWIAEIELLNSTLNRYIKGAVALPSFTHGYGLTNNRILNEYKVEIGLFLESYYETVGIDATKDRYVPTNLKTVGLGELSRN